MDATLRLTKHPSSIAVIHEIANTVAHLKQLLEREKREVSMHHHRSSSERRNKLQQLSNLIQYIEIQAERVEKTLNPKKRSHGLHYYVLATISNVVLGVDGVAQIGRSMESRLRSWLDQQGVRDLIQLIIERCGSNISDERIILAISSFEYSIKKGVRFFASRHHLVVRD